MLISTGANADIFDRIDRCEDMGGGSCVYSLLRELAHFSPTGPEPTYETSLYDGDNCTGRAWLSLRTDTSCQSTGAPDRIRSVRINGAYCLPTRSASATKNCELFKAAESANTVVIYKEYGCVKTDTIAFVDANSVCSKLVESTTFKVGSVKVAGKCHTESQILIDAACTKHKPSN